MTDVSSPFAGGIDSEDPRYPRRPTTEEKSLGFPSGPADIALFNGLLNMIYREFKTLADAAGVSGSDANFNLLRDSIDALISAATGGGEGAGYILLSQARARLPIHFEVLSADGKVNVSSPSAGTVRVPGGVDFLHRGIFTFQSAETDFSTDGNKTYHIRWNPDDGFNINDLADGGYNPSALAETDASFDGAYDDALIARVITNASNIATITNLANLSDLRSVQYVNGANGSRVGENGAAFDFEFPLNWSRTPRTYNFGVFSKEYLASGPTDEDVAIFPYGNPPSAAGDRGTALSARPVTRYSSRFNMMMDQLTALTLEASFGA